MGVKLIAAYLLLKAVALILAATIVHTRPDLWPGAKEFISNAAINVVVPLPYPTAFLYIAVGLGILFLKRWSRKIIVLTNIYGLCRMAVGSILLMQIDRKFLIAQISSQYFAFNLVAGILILIYLLRPDVMSAFGEPQ
ncbi:MAG TPA: hypothetical protein VNU94_06260 [Acidobacteriaceae bacterium]|jgi:hypothetical protein|nr:hypothetical protein [Acidobacteriaceae bacterium]